MSEPSETSGRPQFPTSKQDLHSEASTINQAYSTRKSSQPSDDYSESSKSPKPRRRTGTTVRAPSSPHAGSSRSEQQSTSSPAKMRSQSSSSINYTRTGRISKAKKGLKVHNCECGRSYTRAEHLRRHQKNHVQEDALVCEYPDCEKTFYRVDLLQRHQERHNDPGQQSPHTPVFSPEVSPEADEPTELVNVSMSLSANTQAPPPYYQPQPVSPMNEPAPLPRYTFTSFLTPHAPRVHPLPSSGLVAGAAPSSIPNGKQTSHHGRYLMAGSVPVDGMAASMGWTEPYSQSPSYSSSSGYASPNLGAGDYMYASVPYGHGATRTRTSSVASFSEPWSYTPRSPTSSASTMPYTWASNDKMPTALAYMGTSYPMASLGISTPIDPMAGYGHFGPRSMMQRDEDEGVILFPEQPYGMGQLAHTYPSEHYLNNFWRHFHPTLPIIHRHECINTPPMLRAAMIAIGGQYSKDPSTKKESRALHDRCIKLLDRREQEVMAEQDRICDQQAVFLVEVLSQYRARRAAKTLSTRFGTLYHKATENLRQNTMQLNDLELFLSRDEDVTLSHWHQWIELSTWQRLAISCYILDSQQATLLAREPLPSLFQESGVDLPFPAHISVWDATNLEDWTTAVQQHSSSPQHVFGVSLATTSLPCDTFQSSILIAAHYNRFNAVTPYVSTPSVEDIDQVIDGSFATQQKLLTAKLLQVTPIRALLAVSGESWILSEKVPSPETYATLRTTLRTWVTQIWCASSSAIEHVPIKEAIRISIQILQLALNTPTEILTLDLGADMGLYFAALVLWAATAAASTRAKLSQRGGGRQTPRRNHSHSPGFNNHHGSTSLAPTSTQLPNPATSYPASTSSPIQSDALSVTHSQPTSPSRHDSIAATTLLSHDQIALNSITFLSVVLRLIATEPKSLYVPDLGSLQAGCVSMLLWVKLQLRGASMDDQVGADGWTGRPVEGHGELVDSAIGSLERLLNRRWSDWGI